MKYCKNCGMLLEDTHERCIKCGADVSIAANVSLYPPEILEGLKSEEAENKSRNKMVILLIVIFVVLIALVGAVIWKLSSGGLKVEPRPVEETAVSEEVAEPSGSENSEPAVSEEVTPEPEKPKNVKDDAGSYYICKTYSDEAGNPVFTGIYPEDLTQADFVIDKELYSDRFCELMSFVVSDEDNTVRFTYMSPQQMWYKKSDKGKSRSNERDPMYFMRFYTYEDAKAYLDVLIKQSYPKAKKIECTGEREVSADLTGKLENFVKSRANFYKSAEMGDYAHIGEDTEYAAIGKSFSAKMYDYQITDADKEVMYCTFYIPVMANDLYYASAAANDMGTITEWFVPCICGLETGNEDLYDENKEAFELFCANAAPTRSFFYICSGLRDDIVASFSAGEEPAHPTVDRIKELGAAYTQESEIDDVYTQIYDFLCSYGTKCVSNADLKIYLPTGSAVAYYDKEAGKLFVSPDETEYPGDSYEELK